MLGNKDVFFLDFSQDKQNVILHGQFGPLITIARNQGGKWVVDTTELTNFSISPVKMMLQIQLSDMLNLDPNLTSTSSERMTHLLKTLRESNYV